MVGDLGVFLVLAPAWVGLVNLLLPSFLRKIFAFALGIGTLWWVLSAGGGSSLHAPYAALDSLALLALGVTQVLALLILIYGLHGMSPKVEKAFFVLHPLTLGFTNGALLADHLLLFVFFWGLSGLMLYLFGLLGEGKEAPAAAKKTFILVGGSDAFLLLGAVLLAFRMPEAGWSMAKVRMPLTEGVGIAAFVCFLIAALAKAGGFPFHTWVPPFAKETPVEAVALLPASLDKILGIYLVARMVLFLFQTTILVNMIFVTIGAITIITAVMMALIQHNGRRLLGYHAVSQVGYMIMGVGSGVPMALAGGLFHMINNTIYKSNLFLALGSVEKRTGTHELDALGGLGNRMPITCVMALVGALSISGIPPFNGFFSKWMIYQGLLERAKDVAVGYELWLLACLVLAVFGSALTLASFLKFLHTVFLGRRPAKHDGVQEAPFNQWLSTGLLAALCLLLGLWGYQVPLRMGILSLFSEKGLPAPEWLGSYRPTFLLGMMAIAFLIGWVVYRATRRIRFDAAYLGGMEALERFRITGTAFYKEIRDMAPLRWCYDRAEKGLFDLEVLLTEGTLWLSGILKRAHSGRLSLYLMVMMAGLLVLIWVH